MFRTMGVATLIVGLAAGGAHAQSADDRAQQALLFSKTMKENTMALRHYSWKSRFELKKKGEIKAVKLDLVRFDIDGDLQTTPLTEEQAKKVRGFGPSKWIRKGVKKKKQKKTEELVQNIRKLVRGYAFPSPGRMVDFFQQGSITPAAGSVLKIKGNNFLRPGDTVTMWVEKETLKPQELRFQTVLGEKKELVDGSIDYRTLASGPYYAARVVVQIPKEKTEATIELFDHVRQGG